jgi:riboflavin synthase
MFTGLIEEIGTIQSTTAFDGGLAFAVTAKKIFSDLKIDDSIAINGCCQTVIKIEEDQFTVQSIKETLDKTNFKQLTPGTAVNLERAMLPTQRMGGHFVQGHVNGTATVASITHRGENKYVGFTLPPQLFQYCIQEGSIAIDGVSLTLAYIEPEKHQVYVSIIPHTWKVTTFGLYTVGQCVNIEVDMLAKMVHQFTQPYHQPSKGSPS